MIGGAFAQDTVYIGGSGQTGVEVDMGALERFQVPLGAGQGLRHPGVADGGLGPVTLRPPDGAPATTSARVETPAFEPAPAKTSAKLEFPAADATITPKLETPDPMPDTVLAIAPEIAPEEMSPDERAAAKERNKNSVSSTSFADEAALMDDDGDATAMPVTLRPPDGAPATTSARVEKPALEPAPAKTAAKLELPAADATITPKLETPDPMPDTVLAIAPEIAPEEMSPDERAAAKERNKNSVSSTSFADEAALMDDDGDAAAMDAKPTSTQPKAEPEPQPETEMATLAPAVAPTTPGETMQIEFGAGESALPQSAQAPLATLAAALDQDETLRLQLRAYAGGDADSASHARRLSLSRALAVRSELIEQGVRSTRIDVRALGNKSENGSSDRVDVILVQR